MKMTVGFFILFLSSTVAVSWSQGAQEELRKRNWLVWMDLLGAGEARPNLARPLQLGAAPKKMA